MEKHKKNTKTKTTGDVGATVTFILTICFICGVFAWVGSCILFDGTGKDMHWEGAKPDTLFVMDKQIASSVVGVGLGGAANIRYDLLVKNAKERIFILSSTETAGKTPDILFAQPGDTLITQRFYQKSHGRTLDEDLVVTNISLQKRAKANQR